VRNAYVYSKGKKKKIKHKENGGGASFLNVKG